MTEGDAGEDHARSASSATRPSRIARCCGLFDLDDRRLAELVHQGRPLLARQAQRRPGDPALLLPEPRLPRVQRSSPPRSRSRPTSRTSRSRSTSREGQPYTVTGVKLEGNYLGKEDEFKTAGAHQARASPTAPTTWPTRPRPSPTVRQLRLCLRAGRAAARDRPRQRPGGGGRSRPSRSAGSMCGASTWPATRARATRWSGASSASSSRPGTTAHKIKLSRDRVDRLGYFKEVDVETDEVPGTPDQVDLTITVAEKPTGNLQLGAGFSSAEKLSLTRVDQAGKRLRLGQLPGPRGQHQQVQPHAGAEHASTRTSRSTASRARSTSTTAPSSRSTARASSTSSPRRARPMRFGVPFTEVRHGVLRHRRRADRDRRRRVAARTATSSTASSSARTAIRSR